MKLPTIERLTGLTVFYDGRCGLCCTFREWLERQPLRVAVALLPYQSAEAEAALPEIRALRPDREMIVRDDGSGQLFRGAEAWVMCLYVVRGYEPWARRLASPRLLPFARKVALHVANHRRLISRVLFSGREAETAARLRQMPPRPAACESDRCDPMTSNR